MTDKPKIPGAPSQPCLVEERLTPVTMKITTKADRLTSREIVILRSLVSRGAQFKAVSLLKWQRKFVVPLWRRGLIEIWYRQSLDAGPMHGPFYALTIFGAALAVSFFPAPRGISGAGERKW